MISQQQTNKQPYDEKNQVLSVTNNAKVVCMTVWKACTLNELNSVTVVEKVLFKMASKGFVQQSQKHFFIAHVV